MDALILTCGTGGGHNAAAEAVREALTLKGHNATVLNPYTLRENGVSEVIDQAYIGLVQRAPKVFGGVYQLGDLYRRLSVRSPVYFANRRMALVLEDYLESHPVDVIVTTHLFAGEILAAMKRKVMEVPPVVYVATDYTCIPLSEETYFDRCVIPAPDLEADFTRWGIPAEKLEALGIPVRKAFRAPLSRQQAREQLGLRDGLYFLVIGGSIGAGNMKAVIKTLLERYEAEGVHIISICGSNQKLYQSLTEQYGDRITLLERTNRIAEYMRACDLVLSKPGGISSTEAAALGTALIHVTPIPGCESRNMAFFAEKGMSLPVSDPKTELIGACETLLEPAALEEMRRCQKAGLPAQSEDKLVALLEFLVASKCSVSEA